MRPALPRPADYLTDPNDVSLLQRGLADRAARNPDNAFVDPTVRRLRRERALLSADVDGSESSATLVLLSEEGDQRELEDSLKHLGLQSHPRIDAIVIGANPAPGTGGAEAVSAERIPEMRQALSAAAWCVFARPGDILAGSTASFLSVLPEETGVELWSSFAPSQAGLSQGGLLHRRPDFDPHTLRHSPSIDTSFAARGKTLIECPDEVLSALGSGRVHPLLFWLSTRSDLPWKTFAGILTIRPPKLRRYGERSEVERDAAVYQKLSELFAADFDLRDTRADLPFPFLLVPRRRAAKTSVIIAGGSGRHLLRCLTSISRQQTTGSLEVIVVADPGTDHAELSARGRQIFGSEILAIVDGGRAPNDSARINAGVAASTGDAIVLCSDGLVLQEPTNLEQLGAWSLQPGVGSVGCALIDSDSGERMHGFAAAQPSRDPGAPILVPNKDVTYAGTLHAVAGNPGVLMGLAQTTFEKVGGFDQLRFPVRQNDVEFMLRCSQQGLKHLYLGHLAARFSCTLAADTSGDSEDDGLECALLRSLYPEAQARACGELGTERVQPKSEIVATEAYRPEDLELLAGRAVAQTASDDNRRAAILHSAAEITEAADRLAAAVSSLQAAALKE